MRKFNLTIVLLAMTIMPIQMHAGSSIKLEFGGTSMVIELSQQPKIVYEGGNLVLKTNSLSVTLSLPCKVSPIGDSGTDIKKVVVRNDSAECPLNVYTLTGKKVATLKDKDASLSLDKGVYIVNGKKVLIK